MGSWQGKSIRTKYSSRRFEAGTEPGNKTVYLSEGPALLDGMRTYTEKPKGLLKVTIDPRTSPAIVAGSRVAGGRRGLESQRMGTGARGGKPLVRVQESRGLGGTGQQMGEYRSRSDPHHRRNCIRRGLCKCSSSLRRRVLAGARWRRVGTTDRWWGNGEIERSIPPGSYEVEFLENVVGLEEA